MKAAIGLLETDLLIPLSCSLKDKRKVIRSIKDRVKNKFNVSVAEVGYQDNMNRCHLAFITISTDRVDVEKRLNTLLELVYSYTELQVLDHKLQWL